jgi:hypothetical protein
MAVVIGLVMTIQGTGKAQETPRPVEHHPAGLGQSSPGMSVPRPHYELEGSVFLAGVPERAGYRSVRSALRSSAEGHRW